MESDAGEQTGATLGRITQATIDLLALKAAWWHGFGWSCGQARVGSMGAGLAYQKQAQ